MEIRVAFWYIWKGNDAIGQEILNGKCQGAN